MRIVWTSRASSDLVRLYEFLAGVNPRAAKAVAQRLAAAPRRLVERPRSGERLPVFAPREIRRLIAGDYEFRYEVMGETIYVLRVWHVREDR